MTLAPQYVTRDELDVIVREERKHQAKLRTEMQDKIEERYRREMDGCREQIAQYTDELAHMRKRQKHLLELLAQSA